MPRNASGIYTLASGNPVDSGTLIEASWANNTLNDLASAMTDSLSRNGEGGMLAPFRLADGSLGAPGIAWTNEPATGFYRSAAGTMWGVVGGAQILQYTSNGILIPSTKTLTAQGNASVGGNLSVTGTLAITGGVTFTGNASVGGTLGVTGATTLSSTLAVTGAITATGGVVGNVTGNLSGNATTATSATTAGSATTATTATNVSGGTVSATTGAFSSTLSVTGATTLADNLVMSGSAKRITGDFSNATISNRVIIQTSTMNGNTAVTISPSGTAANSSFFATNNSDVNNASTALMRVNLSEMALISGVTGTGTYLPMAFLTNNTTQLSIATSGTATFTQNPILNAGSANGVVYLNGSKVATSGSALTFDGTKLQNTGGVISKGGVSGAEFSSNDSTIYFSAESSVNRIASTYGSTGSYKPIAFNVNDVEQMRLTSTGLGIGTSSPAVKLDVSGADGVRSRVIATSGGTSGLILSSSGNTAYTIKAGNADNSLRIDQDGTDRITLASGGNLGIGTSSPSRKLQVQDTSSNPFISIYAGASGIGGLLFDKAAGAYGQIRYDNSADAMWFTTNSTERMRLDSSGNLGLGVTPSAWSANYKPMQLGQYASVAAEIGSVGQALFANNVYATGTGSSPTYNRVAGSSASMYLLDANVHKWFTAGSGVAGSAITFTQAMTLDASGNLGVGTTSPGAKLEVAGTTSNTLIWNTTTTAANGFSARNTGGQFYFGIDDSGGGYYNTGTAYGRALYSTGAYPMVFFTNATERARITSGGFFKASNSGSYVNSTANYHEIDSNQQSLPALMVYASNASYDYGDGIFMVRAARNTTNNSFYAIEYFNETAGTARFRVADSGNVTNTNNSYGAISDIKLKENITDATPKLGGLMQVRVRNYNLKSDPEHKQLGVIAQELEQVFPGMVEESPDRDADGNDLGTTTKQVKYSVFVPMLIKAMQEQQVIIEQLKADVAALKGA